ncbi:MAG TPA: hypothetical protein PLJ38_10495, partial [bacterium]|nr:hypothetical protein [bacterium]
MFLCMEEKKRVNKQIEFVALTIFTSFIIFLVYIGDRLENSDWNTYYFVFLAIFAAITVLISPEKGLYILIIVSMFSPEISLGRTGRRNIILRFDDIMVVLSMITWLVVRIMKKNI